MWLQWFLGLLALIGIYQLARPRFPLPVAVGIVVLTMLTPVFQRGLEQTMAELACLLCGVPFGEFVPWPFGLVTSKVSTEAGDFEAGRNVVVSKLGAHRIATFICYESVFPGYIRRFTQKNAEKDGAEALFNISNDSWFGKSQARYQHLQIVRMRAVENRRWIVRATNNGISAVIDPAGRLVHTMPEYTEAAARLRYSYRNDQTIYTKYGDWFVAVCAAGACASLLRVFTRYFV